MPSYQEVFKDTYPTVVFSNDWHVLSSDEDPLIDTYGQITATRTNTPGANMTFRFFGNMISVFGSKRPTHGLYNVVIDGNTYPTLNASNPTPLFNQTLFNTTLDNGEHTLVLSNVGNTTLDVDYLSMNSIVGNPDEVLGSDTIQDDHPIYHYTGNWIQPYNPGYYSGIGAHITTDPNATMQLFFRVSTALNLFGGISPTACAAFSVSLNGGPFHVYSARRNVTKSPQILYHTNNLGDGVHNILIQFNTTDNATHGEFIVDFSNIYTLPSIGGTQFVLKSSLKPHGLPKSAIIGLSVVSVVAFLSLLGLVFLLFKQKRQPKGQTMRQISPSSSK